MNFAERSAKRKRAHELRGEIKQLKKRLIMAGCDKTEANRLFGEFEETLLLTGELSEAYEVSTRHIGQARDAILRLLDFMGESPADEVKESLTTLMEDLELVYHDCVIREDDLDFQSTINGLKGLISSYGSQMPGQDAIMLRSELENIKAVLDDASGFGAPDFFALAYYNLHGDRRALKEMENEQRNRFLTEYVTQHFSEEFWQELQTAHLKEDAKQLLQQYILC